VIGDRARAQQQRLGVRRDEAKAANLRLASPIINNLS
jgi:hypothetical protein